MSSRRRIVELRLPFRVVGHLCWQWACRPSSIELGPGRIQLPSPLLLGQRELPTSEDSCSMPAPWFQSVWQLVVSAGVDVEVSKAVELVVKVVVL
ncbi:hypothetical protein Drorol1_Dr00022315 [Drosera rotundifolia]